nr:ribonuclease H-like domain-containing protein [Tanacetum cinerariifolium]
MAFGERCGELVVRREIAGVGLGLGGNSRDKVIQYSSVETPTSMPALVNNAPKVVCKPKVWIDAPIIEEYESDSDDDLVSNVQENKEKPCFAYTDYVKHVKPSTENVKEIGTPNHSLKVEKQDRNGHTKKGLGYAFTRKACFVYGSFSHLIREYDFHEKRMAKQAELTKSKNKVTSQRVNRTVWNNVQRVNHKNKFVPTVVLTKTGKIPVNAARQNYSSQVASTSTASTINTARTLMHETRPKRYFYKTYSPNKRDTAVKASTCYNWRNKRKSWNKDDPHKALKDKGFVNSGFSRHIIGNKAHLVDYQEFKGGFVAFGGSNGRITGKGKIKAGRQHDMYSFNLKNIDSSRDLACLFAKASIDESNKWNRRLGHVNFKNLNKLVMGNLVRGLPYKVFENDHTCVACQKGKQHKAFCKAKIFLHYSSANSWQWDLHSSGSG